MSSSSRVSDGGSTPTSSPKLKAKKKVAVPLHEFLADTTPLENDPEGALPEGPAADASNGSSEARKVWIAEWGGRAEVLGADVLATRPPGQMAETVRAVLARPLPPQFLSNGDLIEATRCVLELGAPSSTSRS